MLVLDANQDQGTLDPVAGGPELAKTVFNGFSIGKGHLAEAKAAVTSGSADNGNGAAHVNTRCGSGDGSARDELLSKIAEKQGS